MANVFNVLDAEMLANKLCGTNHEETDEIETAINEKYDIDLENFIVLVSDLMNLMSIGVSPLTNTPMIGFADEQNSIWLIKKEITSQFIGSVIQWLMEGESLDKKPKGITRFISIEDVPVYDIVIRKAEIEELKSTDNGCNVACGENYCDENGCVNRKRILTEPIEPTKSNNI